MIKNAEKIRTKLTTIWLALLNSKITASYKPRVTFSIATFCLHYNNKNKNIIRINNNVGVFSNIDYFFKTHPTSNRELGAAVTTVNSFFPAENTDKSTCSTLPPTFITIKYPSLSYIL